MIKTVVIFYKNGKYGIIDGNGFIFVMNVLFLTMLFIIIFNTYRY